MSNLHRNLPLPSSFLFSPSSTATSPAFHGKDGTKTGSVFVDEKSSTMVKRQVMRGIMRLRAEFAPRRVNGGWRARKDDAEMTVVVKLSRASQ